MFGKGIRAGRDPTQVVCAQANIVDERLWRVMRDSALRGQLAGLDDWVAKARDGSGFSLASLGKVTESVAIELKQYDEP